jgi:hypothetical protein
MVLKVETDIIASIGASQTRWSAMLVIMFEGTSKLMLLILSVMS